MVDQVSGIAAAVENQYGVEVRTVVHLKTVFLLVTQDDRRFIWKFVRGHDSESRLAGLHFVVHHLAQFRIHGAGPVPTLQGGFIAALPTGERGYLQEWLKGRHVSFANRQERLLVVATMAQFHQTAGFPIQGQPYLAPGGVLPVRVRTKRAALQEALELAIPRMPELREMESTSLEAADEALAVVARAEAGGWFEWRFCHRDLAPHNLLMLSDGTIGIIDFDRAGWDDPFLDWLQLFNHGLFFTDPQPGYFEEMFDVYTRAQPLFGARAAFLRTLAGFPELLTRALVEWVRADCLPERRIRVEWALAKERLRRTLLADTTETFTSPLT